MPFPPKFQNLFEHSQYFTMLQTSDILQNNVFDHITFLGKTQIDSSLINYEGDETLFEKPNTILTDDHIQVFIDDKSVVETETIALNHTRERYPFKRIESPATLFEGVLSVETYFILVNSEKCSEYNVYVMSNDTNHEGIEYFCFVKIGHLINPKPFTGEEIIDFETKNGFLLEEEVKMFLMSHSRIIQYESHIFLINLNNEFNNGVFESDGRSCYDNNRVLTNMKRLILKKNKMFEEEYEERMNDLRKEEEVYMNELKRGLLYLGHNEKTRFYLRLRWKTMDEDGNDPGFSMWIYDETSEVSVVEKKYQMVMKIKTNI